MNAMSEKTRLGLEILGAATVLGVSGDLLLRATPWGLNALLCAAGLVAAGGYIVHRHRIAVSADALWLAVAILLLASNFIARDSVALRALDSIGLAILCCLACLSLRGVAIRGLHAWEYVQAGFAAAVGACVGALALVGRDVRWEELPSGGALRSAFSGASPAATCCAAWRSSFNASSSVRTSGEPAARSIGVSVARSYVPCRSGWPSAIRGIDSTAVMDTTAAATPNAASARRPSKSGKRGLPGGGATTGSTVTAGREPTLARCAHRGPSGHGWHWLSSPA